MARQLARSPQGRFRRCSGFGFWLMVLVALAPLTAFAQLAPRHSFNVRGDVAMVGNALLTCATSGTGSANCASQRMSNSTGGNGNRVMEFINVDAEGLPSAVPANSSAATLSVPAGARIRSAGLYWGARAGNTDAARRTIQLRLPGGTYRSVTASAADLNTFNDQGDTNANRPYTAYADVTALVAASGNGTYYAGGLTAVTGNGGGLGNYGGWALIVLYEDDSKPFRRLMVFDGNAGYVSGGNAQSASVSGLLTPASGPFNAFMGALVWEGDGDITGDAFQLSGNGNVLNAGAVSDALSPANNFWNSGITRLGERFTNKTPDYANQFAVDLKLVDISNNAANAASARPRLANSATGATLTFTSTGDAYFPHALVFVTDLFVPDLVSSLDKTVRNLTHPAGPLRRGDILEYTISFQNSGQDGATRTTVRDPIPTHTAFVPGSLRVVSDEGRGISSGDNPAETDSAGDDVAEFDAAGNRVVFRVGAGADATDGGLLTPGQGATLRFQVKVSDTAPDTAQIINNAEVTHNGQTVEVPDDYEGRASATIGPVEVPAIAAVDFCPADGGIFGVVNGAGFRRFVPGASTDGAVGDLAISLPGNLNGLMVDAARNRLLFHTRANGSGGEVWAYDANNGGWYQTGAVIAADLPRAGMTREGIGYMVTAVSGRTARMYRLDPAGTFGYTPGAPTTLTYDVAPSDTGSGDIAFDQDGIGWLVAGSDLYRVDVDAGTATLQQRFTGAPNGAFYAGAAFGADGRLYVVVNATGNYYAMDLATGTMTLAGNSSLAGGGDRGRDLASCSFPAIAPPQLQVDKVLGAVNGDVPGSSVAPGDVLEYEIRVRHVAGSQAATLFAGDVVEGVPANTTFLPAGSDFTCSAAVCSNTNAVNITAGGSVTLRFRVQVAATVPSTATAIRNEVAVQGNTPVDCAAIGNDCEETTPLTLTPGLASTKALSLVNGAAPSGTVAVGDVLTYTVTATNTGNMVLPSVVVADARIVPASITCTDLAPAAACVLTGVYTVTQADVDAGLVRNTATITTPGTDGVCPVGNSNASCSPTLEIPADPALPALTIVKTARAPGTSAVGNTIAYSFLLTNTGNVTLNALAVVDDKLSTPPVCPVTTLAPGATTTCTGTYTLVQADLDAGRVVNTAHAEGTPPATPGNPNPPRVPSPEDEETTDLTSAPALTIVKTAGPPSGTAVGSTIAYSFLVTNTGNVTLTGIAVVDDKLSSAPVCPLSSLAPGASTICTATYMLVQSDLDAGRVVNTAYAEGTPPATPGNPTPPRVPSPEDEETSVLPAMPSLTLVKTAGSPSGNAVGSTIPYSFLVTNTGNITLTAIAVVDSKLITAPTCPVSTLAPGATTTCTGSYVLTQSDLDTGRVLNTAYAEGTPPATPGNPTPPRVPSPEDDETTELAQTPSVTSVKQLAGNADEDASSTVTLGDTLTYAITVTNTGNTTLASVTVSDARIVPSTTTCSNLAPTLNCVLTGTYRVSQNDMDSGLVRNTAVVSTPGNLPLCLAGNTSALCNPTLDIPVDAPAPALSIVKSAAAPTGNAVGSTIAYTFVVTNTGNVTLSGIAVVDAKLSVAPVCPVTTLAPGAATTCTGRYTLVQADLDAGRVVNAAHAEGTPPATPSNPNPPRVPSPEDEEITPLQATPALTIVKTAGTPSGNTVGSTIAYSFLVTNTGNVTVTGVAVVDDKLAQAALCPTTTLAPGGTTTCTGTYTLVQADLDAGRVVNVAHAEGTPPATPGNPTPPRVPSPEDEETTDLPSAPSLSIVKTAGTPSGAPVGSTIAYTFVVTNTGNVTLNDIRIVDAQLAVAPVCPTTTLAPGAAVSCTGSYTLSQLDLDAGRVVNRAHAEGVPPATPGNPNPPRVPSPEDEATVDLPAAPSLSIEKTAGPASGNAVGSTIAYTFLVTNTGNLTLTAVNVVDSRLATAPNCPVTVLAPGASTVCTGSYTLVQADLDAGEVVNTAHAEGTSPSTPGNPGSGRVTSPEDTVRTPVAQLPALESTKLLSRNADEDGSGAVSLNDTLTYTITATNAGNTTLKDVVVTDSRITPASVTCAALAPAASCVLTGTYQVSQADVVAGNVRNVAAVATATPGLCGAGNDDPICSPSLDIPVLAWDIDAVDDRDRTPQNTPVTTPVLQNDLLDGRAVDPATVQVSELLPPTNGSIVVNDDGTITYTPNPGFWGEDSYEYQICERANPSNCTTARVVIAIDPNRVEAIDDAGRTEPGVPLQLVVVGNDRSHGAPLDPDSVLLMTPPANGSVTCAAGSCSYTPTAGFAGTDTYVYRVCDTSYPTALCADATVTVDIEGTASLRLTKSTTSRDIKTGDLVRYSVTIENVGTVDLTGGSVLDTPPAGFTYVEGSLAASDARSTVVASGFNPIRFDGIDLKVGDQMTLVYLMRVGAGVQRGVQINRAQALDGTGQPASNVATAEVVLDADPLLDESLLFGTVFDDRDGDGWQDSAALTGLKVQGGFAAGDYVAGSTLVDNGDGAGLSPVADASAPLLRGLSLGRLSGRQTVADPTERHAVVIRQRLRTAAFTDDFVLESDQGIRVRMAADGSTRIERRGDAAKGLTAAAPVVERRSVVEGNEVVVDYIIRNEGIDERGIPGVRLASVEGLLIETDQFGRYHLTGVDGGAWTHGRNFILKVDPSTLPAGAGFTTANPLLRRVTPGVPVRFDFGVRMPEPIRADAQAVELELGEVLFAPDSAVVRPHYGAVLEKMAAQVEIHGGGDVLIRGDGNQALGYQRAVAVRDALVARLRPGVAQRTTISVRGDLGDPASRSLTLQGADTLLGTVLFDTDKAEIRPEFGPLMEQVAVAVAQVKGRVIVTGHTDVRGSHAYNRQLGLRRAQAVQRAIAANLPPGTVQAVNVEYNDDPATPAEHGR
ncbi:MULTISPECIES: Ig-like domain-containing protein [unclassified Stenotrophomonas]|uniref:DUF7507 domain-containing protein n=1 Tax=unclassified Stenotrophomonas TaxID=196198 RepID=UPI0018E30450|nr:MULTISPECIES: Ig-like domain-containing protein [unclassified Stenotrophomonas]